MNMGTRTTHTSGDLHSGADGGAYISAFGEVKGRGLAVTRDRGLRPSDEPRLGVSESVRYQHRRSRTRRRVVNVDTSPAEPPPRDKPPARTA